MGIYRYIILGMDSFDLEKELIRYAQCADALYKSLYPSELSILADTSGIMTWYTVLDNIAKRYNTTTLIPDIQQAREQLLDAIHDKDEQRKILKKLHGQLRKVINEQKQMLHGLYSQEREIAKPPFKIKLGNSGNSEIFIDDCKVIYDATKNSNKRNNQWLPIIIAFITKSTDRNFQLPETTIEDEVGTTRGEAMNKCISKINKILIQNYYMYREKGRKISLVQIKKYRNRPIRYLEINK